MFKQRLVYACLSLSLFFVVLPVKYANGAMSDSTTQSNVQNNLTINIYNNNIRENAYLTSTQYKLFQESLSHIQGTSCQRDLNKTLTALVNGEQWAIAMYDASIHEAIGIESGIQYHFGHYDQCLQALPLKAIITKYCLVDIYMDGINIMDNVNTLMRRNRTNPLITHWGECVPASCLASDLNIHLKYILQHRHIKVYDDMCQLRNVQLNVTTGMFYYAVIICFFIFLTFFSTAYHVYKLNSVNKNEKNGNELIEKFSTKYEILDKALLTFSIIENTGKLFQASKDQLGLNSVNGIKSIAMILILAGHMLIFRFGSPSYNVEFMNKNIKTPIFAFLTNSVLFVDLFLLLSGFLFCRILLTELEKRRGKINFLVLYVGRYIRLTPAYIAIMALYMTWLPTLGNGPIWQQRIEREQKRCISSWWLNILYINNYINVDNLCMFQSWYLAADTQLFVIAAIIIYLLHKSSKYGLFLTIALIVTTSIIPTVITYNNALDPTFLLYADEVEDLSSNDYFRSAYIKTHMRASSYVFGLLTGYIVHRMQIKCNKMPDWLVNLGWIFAILCGTGSMFAVSRFYVNPFNKWESALYAGLHKFGWNLAVSWLLVVVTTDHSKYLRKFLSNRIFAPISRLTYCAYLSNGLVGLYHSSKIKNPIYFGYIDLIDDVFSHIVHTFILASILCLLFESPIHALERMLLKRDFGEKRSSEKSIQKSNTITKPV